MMYNHGEVRENEFETVCCDVGVMRKALWMTNKV